MATERSTRARWTAGLGDPLGIGSWIRGFLERNGALQPRTTRTLEPLPPRMTPLSAIRTEMGATVEEAAATLTMSVEDYVSLEAQPCGDLAMFAQLVRIRDGVIYLEVHHDGGRVTRFRIGSDGYVEEISVISRPEDQ